MVFVHMVWFEWKDDATSGDIDAIGSALLALRGRIPGVLDIWFGPNVTKRTPHTHGLLVLLDKESDLPIYNDHELHQAVVRMIAAQKKAVNALDFDGAAPPPAVAPRYTLVVGTKNYSSWSMRPWLAMKHAGIAFNELLVDVGGAGRPNPALRALSPSGLVPCLQITAGAGVEAAAAGGALSIWESLAIIEYLHEAHPAAGVWPSAAAARAHARSIAAEMASGFGALRSEMPVNIKFSGAAAAAAAARAEGRSTDGIGYPKPYPDALAANLARVDTIFAETRAKFGAAAGGPFLFGRFSAADAMFAPVCLRLHSYNVVLPSDAARAYVAAVLADAAVREWVAAARAEQAAGGPGGRAIAHYDEASRAKGAIEG